MRLSDRPSQPISASAKAGRLVVWGVAGAASAAAAEGLSADAGGDVKKLGGR